jgi:hypothetical protein
MDYLERQLEMISSLKASEIQNEPLQMQEKRDFAIGQKEILNQVFNPGYIPLIRPFLFVSFFVHIYNRIVF